MPSPYYREDAHEEETGKEQPKGKPDTRKESFGVHKGPGKGHNPKSWRVYGE